MNILFCLDSSFSRENGGIAAVSLALRTVFLRKGHKCYMMSATKNRDDEVDGQSYLPNPTGDSYNSENQEWFRNFIADNQIDVIINQNGSTPKSLWSVLWAKGIPIRKLTVYHSDFTSLWSCRSNKIANNKLVRNLRLNKLLDYVWNVLFRMKYKTRLRCQYKLSDKVVFLTDRYYKGFHWFSGIRVDEKFAAIHNPIEDRFLSGAESQDKEKVVLFVGRLSSEKGVDYLLEIWEKVYSCHPDWRLEIVGDGPERIDMEYYAQSLGLKNAYFVGFSDPLQYYKRASIVCMTSRTEGFGVVLIEGMACGCVPLAFDSYACASDIIDDGENGFLVKPFDVEEYAKKLSFLMEDEILRDNLIKAAKEKAKQFSLDKIVMEWEHLFER